MVSSFVSSAFVSATEAAVVSFALPEHPATVPAATAAAAKSSIAFFNFIFIFLLVLRHIIICIDPEEIPGRAQESIFLCESEILIHDNTTGTIAMIIFQDRHDQLLVTRNEPSPVPTNGRFPGLLLSTYKTAFPVSQWRIFCPFYPRFICMGSG